MLRSWPSSMLRMQWAVWKYARTARRGGSWAVRNTPSGAGGYPGRHSCAHASGRCRSLPSSRWPRPGSASPVRPVPAPRRRAPNRPAPTAAAAADTTPPPTAPARGNADLVIWTDDTRQADGAGHRRAVRRGERHHRRRPGARLRRHPRPAHPDRAHRRGPRHHHRRPRLARRARRQRRRRAARPLRRRRRLQPRRRPGVHVRRPDLRPAVRHREHRPACATPTSCPRRRRRSRR